MSDNTQPRRTGPRLNHKKSRAGCQRCKARRVKCDEARPACGGCNRHSVPCTYPSPLPSSQHTSTSNPRSTSTLTLPPISTIQQSNVISNDPLHLPESRERRLLELRLWHNYLSVMATLFNPAQRQPIMDIWRVHIPTLAFEYENLLYSIYAASSTYLLRSEQHNQDLITAHQTYLSFTLRGQREALNRLDTMDPSAADAACFTSLFIVMDAFASLQERNREPYTPPIDVLRLGMGTYAVFEVGMQMAKNYEHSKIVTFAQGPPQIIDNIPKFFSEANRKPFLHLLGARDPEGRYEEEELWDAEVSDAYERTLSYIGTLLKSIEDKEPLYALCRRISVFSLLVPRKFVDMLEELKPRALVVLAYFFALASRAEEHWWVGKAPTREVQGLWGIVPQEWHHQMRWPLIFCGLQSEQV